MSRLCVKNLPKHATEERIRDFFSRKGEVTDAKLMRTKDGKSRQFGFVGYRTEQEAEEAVKYFNKSYMDSSRIICEIARKVGDPEIPRPWSRHSLKKHEKPVQVEKENPLLKGKTNLVKNDNENEDPLLQEFLQVMQPRVKSKLWADDAGIAPIEQNVIAKDKKNKKEKVPAESPESENSESSDSDSGEKIKLVDNNEVISDMDYFKSKIKTEWSESESSDQEDDNKSSDGDEDNEASKSSHKKNSKAQDKKMDLKGHQNVEPSDVDLESISPKDFDDKMNNSVDPSSNFEDNETDVLETGRLFVRNLPYTASEEDLEEHFRKFGDISEVHLVVDKDTNRSKGFAFVLYSRLESAARALKELDNSIFQGRLLHIIPAKQQNPSKKQESNTLTVKQRREDARKASEASGNTRAWNSLFMRSDTVVENVARKLGVSTRDILDRDADGLAVRLALAETQVVADTKKSLANAGVNVASLEKVANEKSGGEKRSKHVILVKNLPYGSSEAELATLFAKFGNLDKIILPETKALALVVFLEPTQARAAFKGLTYKRFKDAPLYLEWAPDDILNLDTTSGGHAKNYEVVDEFEVKKRLTLEQIVEAAATPGIDDDRVESRSLYVKNLNFKTTDESLKEHFSRHTKDGKLISARVSKHTKKGKLVSMGFGFVEFDSVDTAVKVSKDLQGTVLDGHALLLQVCQSKKDEKVLKKSEKDRSSTKLIVRNVAFEATEKELRQLFSPFGQIKSLRLPRKFENHRGFAFVEFVTKQETENALKALANTHFYGRHLVMERAKEGETLEELRARTAAQFGDGVGLTKLSKKRKHVEGLDEEF